MSSSGSDVDLDIHSPASVRLRQPAKKTKGKGMVVKPLVVKNGKKDDEESDDSEDSPLVSSNRPQKGRKRPSDPKWDDDLSEDAALALDSDEESGPGPSRENQQNQPPQGNGRPKMTVVDSDEDSEDDKVSVTSSKRTANPRIRKRLSIRRQDSAKPSSAAATVNGNAQNVGEPTPDPETLKKIYSSCIDLFQTQKITVENAFNIRFLELMGDIIDLPEFDKHDMLGAGRMLEAGAKIYVCRVDKTKLSVMDLASTLNMQQRNKKRNETAADIDNEDGEGDQEAGDDNVGEEERPSKKKRKRKLKENQYIVEDISKISLPVEVDSCKGGARRAALKIKFQDFIENDIDFDYFNEYLAKVGPSSKPSTPEEDEGNGDEKLVVTTAVVNIAEFGSLQHLPMILLEDFDKMVHDIWGKRLEEEGESPENGQQNLSLNQPPGGAEEIPRPLEEGEAELVYVPQEQPPQDYNPEVADNFDDDRGFANDTFVNDDGPAEGTQETGSGTRKLTSLEDFFQIYQKVKSSFGWCGPTFVKNQRFNLLSAGAKKPRTKRVAVFIDVKNTDKRANSNKFLTVKTGKGVFDERNVERWSSKGRPAHPYLEIDDPDEEYEEVLELINDEEKLEIPDLFRYFVDVRRNLLGSLSVAPVQQDNIYATEMNKAEDDYIHEAGFEYERHAEADGADAFANDDGLDFHEADIPPTGAPFAFDGSFNFPISLSNLLMESEQDHTQKTDTESIRFTKKPKPIDMHGLKRAILEHLQETLQFQNDGRPCLEGETTTDFISLLKHVLNTVDIRTAEHMSISILAVGLLHVVVENRLFVLPNPDELINPFIVCRGSQWNHAENIPLPIMIEDDDLD